MGRMVRAGARGVIPQTLRPILERLSIDIDQWLTCMTRETTRIIGSAIGRTMSLMREAARRGSSRVWSSMRIDRV